MPKINILTESELRSIVGLDLDAVACVEQAFVRLATESVVMPPILRLDIPEHNGEVDVKTAYVPGIDSFAIKISPGFFDNPKLGLASVNGLMILFSVKTGLVEALLLDNGYLTDVRTAAAGAVATKYLSRPEAKVAAILGTGTQAALQLEAITLVRSVERARVWGRRPERARELAKLLGNRLHIAVEAAESVQGAIDGADIIVTTTPSREALLRGNWLSPGQHITAMGSDAEHKNELAPSVIERADLYVADSLSQVRRLGELHHAIDAGVVQTDTRYPELGEIVAGRTSGRCSSGDITVCDLTGTGVQDTAIATLAASRAASAKIGQTFES